MTSRLLAVVGLLLCFTGCVRREGRNSDCHWPGESPTEAATPRHLSADAEFAEDLAIRYADTHFGLRSPNPHVEYDAERDRCMRALFESVAQQHGVAPDAVSRALGQNRAPVDAAIDLPFILLYCLGAMAVARLVCRRYPVAGDGWVSYFVMALFISLTFATASTMLGQVWCGIAEAIRTGNGHASYRADRIWWTRHFAAVLSGAVVIFWLAWLAAALRPKRPEPPSGVLQLGDPAHC